MKIRIKFQKQGPLRFIGHLDVMRYFQKVMRRAEVAIRYSEGFSPHQIMSFASPLSVGLTSCGEYMDIEVHATEDSAEMIRRINAVSAEGLEILSYRQLPDGAKNAMSQVAAADYAVWFKDEYRPESEKEEMAFWQRAADFGRRDSIPYIKQTKKGEREVDLSPLICEIRVEQRGHVSPSSGPDEKNIPCLFLRLLSGSAANGKPEQLLEAFCREQGLEWHPFAFQAEREELYASEEKDGSFRFVPLMDYGTDLNAAGEAAL